MTSKKIIINDIDVSKCIHRFDNFCEIDYERCNTDLVRFNRCEDNRLCFFKQLKRAKQKLEEISEYCSSCNLKAGSTACDILDIIESEEKE